MLLAEVIAQYQVAGQFGADKNQWSVENGFSIIHNWTIKSSVIRYLLAVIKGTSSMDLTIDWDATTT